MAGPIPNIILASDIILNLIKTVNAFIYDYIFYFI